MSASSSRPALSIISRRCGLHQSSASSAVIHSPAHASMAIRRAIPTPTFRSSAISRMRESLSAARLTMRLVLSVEPSSTTTTSKFDALCCCNARIARSIVGDALYAGMITDTSGDDFIERGSLA